MVKPFPHNIDEFVTWISEIKIQNPDLYKKIENHFKFREMDRKLGVLLEYNDTVSGCSADRVEDHTMVKSGSSRDKGIK